MNKEQQEKYYNELRKTLTDEEIAESFVFSTDLTEEESLELQNEIKKRRLSMSDIEKERVKSIVEKIRKENG